MNNYKIENDNIHKVIDQKTDIEYLQRDVGVFQLRNRKISGTYKNCHTGSDKSILELRVDVDGRRLQNRLSGDFFSEIVFNLGKWLILKPLAMVYKFKLFKKSFIVESVTHTINEGVSILTGSIKYYDDPSITDETIEVRILRVSYFSKAADAIIKIYKSGSLIKSYCSPKISEYYRTVNLEIDRFQGTSFPPTADMNLSPSPSDLPTGNISSEQVFKNAGIDLTVSEDDILNDSDSSDVGSNWDEAELHQLMEDNYDKFGNYLQWNVYGVVVPKFGDPNYDSGYYGTMFDWGGWQTGDSYLRQGAAIAEDAIKGRSVGTLYNTSDKKDRLILQTFCHEIGHAFNLPHSWQRSNNPDSASESFMNYPWGFTGGTGGENQFWTNFRWEFDDDELIWMRHGNRRDVIFGGNDWIGNNLSRYTEPENEMENAPLSLEIRGREVLSLAEPVRLELKLKNISSESLQVVNRLQPEDQLLAIYIKRPNGEHVRYIAPVRRFKAPGDVVDLAPGESVYSSVMLSYGAKGLHFQEPGEYLIRAYYGGEEQGFIMSRSFRLRISAPHSKETEELVHLMFDHRAAKFMYFNGGHRYPQIVSKLQEASKKYIKSHPEIIRHVQVALGLHFARDYKRINKKRDKRVISLIKADNKEANKYMSDCLKILPGEKKSYLDNITFNRVSSFIIDSLEHSKKWNEAESQLIDSLDYLQNNKVVNSVISKYKRRLKKIKKKTEV